jgi:hypothetical protein
MLSLYTMSSFLSFVLGLRQSVRHRVSIIGTEGGRGAAEKMSQSMFQSMCQRASSIIELQFGLHRSNVILVSGGAAWSDHVAVQLYMDSVLEESVGAGFSFLTSTGSYIHEERT